MAEGHNIADRMGRRRGVPWGLIGALVLIALVERSLARRSAYLTTEVAACWKYAAESATSRVADGEILGFGDSLMKYGFQPRVIEARTGRAAFNLASYGAPPSMDLIVLRRVLDSGKRPSALVVCFQVVHLGGTARYHAREFAEFVTPSEAYGLARADGDPGLFGWLMMARLLPSLRSRFEIRGKVLTALRGEGPDWSKALPVFRRNWNRNRGAHVGPGDPLASGDLTDRARSLYPDAFRLPENSAPEVSIRRFLDLAASHDIPVVWVLPPMPAAIEARQEQTRIVAATDALLGMLRRDYPGLMVLDGRRNRYADDAFCADGFHLNSRGANAFSRDVGDFLRKHRGDAATQASWAALPRYRPGPPEADLEDMALSSKRLLEGREARR